MDRSQLEHIVRAAAAILDTGDFVVVGSQSILGMYPQPPAPLVQSMEVDLYPRYQPERSEILSAALGELSPFHETFGIYADGVSETTAKLPDGWRDRLVELRNDNTNGATAWCIDPTDLAIAKHAAGREKDIAFVATMVRHQMLDRSAFLERLETVDIPVRHREAIATRFRKQVADASAEETSVRDRRHDPSSS